MLTLATFIHNSIESQPQQSDKKKKRNQNWKEKSKTVIADDTTLYRGNPKNTTKELELLKQINDFS